MLGNTEDGKEELMTTINVTLDLNDTDQATVTISRTADGAVLIRKDKPVPDAESATADEQPADDAVVASIFERWMGEDPDSGAFELVRQLRERGIGIVAPKNRVEDKNVEPYVRLVAKSASGVTVAAYVNTASMVVSRQKLRATAASAPGADVRANGNVYFDVDDVAGCLAVVDKLMAL